MSSEPARARVRASDAEREEYARIVRDAIGEGRLTLDEGDARLATIYQSVFRDELRPLIADLPADPVEPAHRWHSYERHPYEWTPWHGPAAYGGPGYGPAGSPQRGGIWARPGVRRWRAYGFAGQVGFVVLVAAALVAIWAVTASRVFWPAIPLTFLALSLVRHLRWQRRW